MYTHTPLLPQSDANRFTGTIPKEIGSLSLDLLNVRTNKFHGNLDKAFCGKSHHQYYAFWADCTNNNGGSAIGNIVRMAEDNDNNNLTCSCCTHCCQDNTCCRQPPKDEDKFNPRRYSDLENPCCTLDVFSNCKSNDP